MTIAEPMTGTTRDDVIADLVAKTVEEELIHGVGVGINARRILRAVGVLKDGCFFLE